MDTSDIATLTLGLAILGLLWTLHKDIASLRECMARLEGTVDLLAGVMLNSKTGRRDEAQHANQA